MISVVICSINRKLFDSIKDSIKKTIGLPQYELIKIENDIEKLSLAKAYNKGLSQAKNEIVCFVHEDVIFHTLNWGEILLNHFEENPNIGLIGVAGSTIKLKAPSSWFNIPEKFHIKNIVQRNEQQEPILENVGWSSEYGTSIKEVAVADGVFLALKKKDALKFDERIRGFHAYDLAISLKCRKEGLIVCVTNDILMEHYSSGTINKAWIRAVFEFSRLYKKNLPVIVGEHLEISKLEKDALKQFIHKCLDLGEKKIAFHYFITLTLKTPLSLDNIIILKRLLF